MLGPYSARTFTETVSPAQVLLLLLSEIVGNTTKMCGYWGSEKETVVIALKDKANLPLHTSERKYKDVQK